MINHAHFQGMSGPQDSAPWTPGIEKLKKAARKLCNKATRANNKEDWLQYRNAQRAFKKVVMQGKRRFFETFCDGVQDTRDISGLTKRF